MSNIRISKSRIAFNILNYTFMVMVSFVFILPFLSILSTSLISSAEAARRGSFVIIPEKIVFTAYSVFFSQGSSLWKAYGVTIFRITIGTFLNLIATSALAYSLSKKFLPGRKIFITLIFITMIFQGGLLPTYLVVRSMQLLNTVWAMIIPSLVLTWNFIIMKAFFNNLPESLEESALIDGASPIRILISIVIPISMPVFATIGLFYAVRHWNSWFDAAIYINNRNLMPVQILLRNVVLQQSMQEINPDFISELGMARPTPASIRSAIILITTIPIIMVYPFIQKYFVKGIMIGSIKE